MSLSTSQPNQSADPERPPRRPGKPRIAIMGEFSAGKSTLSNMLIGRHALPTKVTATQLPPVWIAHGTGAPFAKSLDGAEVPFDYDRIDQVSPDDTAYIRIFHQTDTLELYDLIDMPGISDPNIPAEVWERVMDFADAVIWCTHATQAWRQSEAAVWETYSDALAAKSLLLVTRFDKILAESDRRRVLKRLEAEAGDAFRRILPISLTQALAAETDPQLWETSGAAGFATALVDLAKELRSDLGQGQDAAMSDPSEGDVPVAHPHPAAQSPCQTPEPGVLPRRVQSSPRADARTERPPRKEPPGPTEHPAP